jgi:hypothetical protein
VSKGQGPDGQRKASINPAAAASLSAANWQGKAKALEAFGTIGRSDGPFRYGANGAGLDSRLMPQHVHIDLHQLRTFNHQ